MKLQIFSSPKTVTLSVSYALRMSATNGIIIRDDPLELKAEVVDMKTNNVIDFDDAYYEWRRVEDGWTPKTGKTITITTDDLAGNAANFYAVFTHPTYSVFTMGNLQIRNIEGLHGWSRAILTLYKRSESTPDDFDGGVVTFTFSTNTLTGDIGTWSKTIPHGDDPLYVIYSTAFANTETDTVEANEWTAPAILSENGTKGEDGMHVYSLTLYQRGQEEPEKPSGTVTYSFESKQVSGAGSWTISIPEGTDPVWAIIATAASNTTGDTIEPDEWTTPVIVFEKGDKGEDAPAIIYQWRLGASHSELENPIPKLYKYNNYFMLWGSTPLSYISVWQTVKPNPTKDTPFIWERYSVDNGVTWTEPVCINKNYGRNITLIASKQSYVTDTAGYVLSSQEIIVRVEKLFTTAPAFWTVYKGSVMTKYSAVDLISINIPVGLNVDSIEVNCFCDGLKQTLTIYPEKTSSRTPIKQSMVQASNLSSITTRDDGSPLLVGDYRVVIITQKEKTYHVPYYWNGTHWATADKNTSNYTEIIMNTMADILNLDSTVPEISALWGFFQDLGANSIVAEMISAMYIYIRGAIYGGNFNELGEQVSEEGTGFHLSKDGFLQAYKASLNDVFITSKDDDGQIILETVKAQSGATISASCPLNMWNQATLFSSLPEESAGLPCIWNGTTSADLYRYAGTLAGVIEEAINTTMGAVEQTYSYIVPASGTLNINASVFGETNYGYSSEGSVKVYKNGGEVLSYSGQYGGRSVALSVVQGDVISYTLYAFGNMNYDPMTGEHYTVTGASYINADLVFASEQILITDGNPANGTVTVYASYSNTDKGIKESLLVKDITGISTKFNSANNLVYASYDSIVSQTEILPFSAIYECNPDSSSLTYQGKTWSIYQVRKTTTDITFYCYDSTSVYRNFTFSFASYGDVLDATMLLITVGTSLRTASLIPATGSHSVGAVGNEYSGVYTKALYLNGQEIYIENGTVKVR